AGKNISPATSLHPTRDLLFLWGGRLARPIFTLFMSIYLEELLLQRLDSSLAANHPENPIE
ncbi:hypothetical protein, partial [Fischerella sp.]|uniref:hypothetical protein n=1 Tax=Fischerella sp. TaxID=1191 RepID=UPI0025BAE7B4